MEPMRLLDFLIMVIFAGLGWWAKVIWGAVSELRRDLRGLEIGVPREYVRKVDSDHALDAVMQSIRDMREDVGQRLDAIWQKLNGKADRQ